MTLEAFSTLATAATSIVAVILAVYTFWHQTQQTKIHLGITIIRECEKDFFYSDELRRQRLITARFLLSRKPEDEPAPEAYELLDFFGSLGGYVERGIVPRNLAFHVFYYWFSVYFYCLKDDIQKLHDHLDGIAYLEHCRLLYERTTRYARKRFRIPEDSVRFSPARIQEFLHYEIQSLERWLPATQHEIAEQSRAGNPPAATPPEGT